MKKRIGIFVLAIWLSVLLCLPLSASAGRLTASGFYDIGSAAGVEIVPGSDGASVVLIEADADRDGTDETLYAYSDRLTLTYTAAKTGVRYGVMLAAGTGFPDRNTEVFYMDQTTASSGTVCFEIRPLLPVQSTDMTLYITSDADGAAPIAIPLRYAGSGRYDTDAFTLGDINNDGMWDAADALKALQIGAELYTPTAYERLAADVNGDSTVDVSDALKILQYGAGLITSWD